MKLSSCTLYFKCEYESIQVLIKATSCKSQVVLRSKKLKKGRAKLAGERANVSVKSYSMQKKSLD